MAIHDHPTRPNDIYSVTPIYNGSHRERDDSYGKVILQLAPRWRIIECRNADQWIIQKRSAEPLDRGKWTSVSYVVSRDKLIELSASLDGSQCPLGGLHWSDCRRGQLTSANNKPTAL
jgi:hypothetical protein